MHDLVPLDLSNMTRQDLVAMSNVMKEELWKADDAASTMAPAYYDMVSNHYATELGRIIEAIGVINSITVAQAESLKVWVQ